MLAAGIIYTHTVGGESIRYNIYMLYLLLYYFNSEVFFRHIVNDRTTKHCKVTLCIIKERILPLLFYCLIVLQRWELSQNVIMPPATEITMAVFQIGLCSCSSFSFLLLAAQRSTVVAGLWIWSEHVEDKNSLQLIWRKKEIKFIFL